MFWSYVNGLSSDYHALYCHDCVMNIAVFTQYKLSFSSAMTFLISLDMLHVAFLVQFVGIVQFSKKVELERLSCYWNIVN